MGLVSGATSWAFPPGLEAEQLLCLSAMRVRRERGSSPLPPPSPSQGLLTALGTWHAGRTGQGLGQALG